MIEGFKTNLSHNFKLNLNNNYYSSFKIEFSPPHSETSSPSSCIIDSTNQLLSVHTFYARSFFLSPSQQSFLHWSVFHVSLDLKTFINVRFLSAALELTNLCFSMSIFAIETNYLRFECRLLLHRFLWLLLFINFVSCFFVAMMKKLKLSINQRNN